jgi:5'-3' exonuclease
MFSGELADTYPTEVTYDYEGVGIAYARKVLVPFADISLVRRVYAQAGLGVDYARNRMGVTSVFKYDPNVAYAYRSAYGTLRFSRAVKTLLS